MFAWSLSQYEEFAAAVRFLSQIPLPTHFLSLRNKKTEAQLVFGGGYFPLVGLLLSLLLSLLAWVCVPILPPLALAGILVITLVLLTGGLHLDGLMDSCDGLFSCTTHERRLEIMHDSRIGGFGAIGGICILLLKFSFVASLPSHTLFPALITVLPSTRWAMVMVLRFFPSARPTGLGVAFRQTITLTRLILASTTSLLVACIVGHVSGLIVWVAITLVALLLALWMTRKLGGLTGDTCGAIAEITEVAGLLAWLLLK